MKPIVSLLACLAWVFTPGAAGAQRAPLVTFSAFPALMGEGVRVEVDILPSSSRTLPQYSFKRTVVSGRPAVDGATSFTDTVACPQALTVLQQLEELPGPQPAIPGLEKNPSNEVLVDGTGYRVSVATARPYLWGDMVLTSNIGTPLAAWVDHTLAALEPCWRPVQLKLPAAR